MNKIHITNFQGVMGNVNNSDITQHLTMTVKPNQIDSLLSYLKNNKIEESDLNCLQQAIASDPKKIVSENIFGPNVSDWVGKMMNKTLSIGGVISATALANLLSTAISIYYGLL